MGQRALYQPAPLAALLQAEQELPLLHVRCSRGRFGPPFPVLVHSKVLPVVLLHHAIDTVCRQVRTRTQRPHYTAVLAKLGCKSRLIELAPPNGRS